MVINSRLRVWLLCVSLVFAGLASSSTKYGHAADTPTGSVAEKPSGTPPNIVFFFTDDQTVSTLGCYGNDVVQTPNIDALAARGTRFNNATVSHSICWVSRTTILTGLVGRAYGTPGNRELARAEAVESLYTDVLRGNGYRTGYFGKWHAKMPPGYRNQDHFDEFEAIGRNPFYKPQPDGSLRHETEVIVDRGIDFIRRQKPDQPFALNMWFNACHAEDSDRRPGIGHFPWPRAVDGMYDDVTIAQPPLNNPAVFDALPDFLKTTINRERFFWRWNTDEKYQTNMRAYYRMVSGIDGAIGRFMAALEEAGLAENTIIVYSADNGYYMGNRGLAGKWSHYEEALRVPMIVADPRVAPESRGQVVGHAALNVDLPATFLDWAGIDVPTHYNGTSLRGLVDGDVDTPWRTETFHEHYAVRNRIPAFEGVRDEQYKYVRYMDDDGFEFLHDRKVDPDEVVNFASDPAYGNKLQEMRARTDALVQRYGGPLHPLDKKFTESTPPHPIASAAVTQRPGKDGFVSLISGRNLNGWDGDKAFWSIEDGAITGKTDGSLKSNRFLTWKGSTIRNFDLQVDVKITEGGNSGLQYRGKSRPELGLDIVSGYQCDVVPSRREYDGMLYEERGRRIVARANDRVVIDPAGQPWIVGELAGGTPAGENKWTEQPSGDSQWRSYRVLVQGNHHQHWIDGRQTADLIDLDTENRSLEGVLAVQVHVGPAMKVQFKNFRIKHLADDLPLKAAEDVVVPAGSIGVRPQGKLPSDWKAPIAK